MGLTNVKTRSTTSACGTAGRAPGRIPARVGVDLERAPGTPPRDLIDRLIAREPAAFEELVAKRGPRMLAVASRYLPAHADAQDAVQDALLNVVRGIDSFQRASRLDTWLHRIVVNCALMSLRRRRRKPESLLAISALDGGQPAPGRSEPAASALDTLVIEESHLAVRQAIELLPPPLRAALVLREVQSLDLKAIAGVLQIGVPGVRARLSGARRAMRGQGRFRAPRRSPCRSAEPACC